MKKGIVIIFGKNDINISEKNIFNISIHKKIKICFVNNGNDNRILKFLFKLKESSKCDVSILNLRKEKKANLALKAGVRYLSNDENINLILHTKPKNIFNKPLMSKLLKISDEDLEHKVEKRVMLRNVYSLCEIINC